MTVREREGGKKIMVKKKADCFKTPQSSYSDYRIFIDLFSLPVHRILLLYVSTYVPRLSTSPTKSPLFFG